MPLLVLFEQPKVVRLERFTCVCVCVYLCVHTCILSETDITHEHINRCTFITHMDTPTCVCVCVCARARARVFVCVRTCMCVRAQSALPPITAARLCSLPTARSHDAVALFLSCSTCGASEREGGREREKVEWSVQELVFV